MIKKATVFFAIMMLFSSSIAHASVLTPIISRILEEASKSAAGELGKTAVDRFMNLFNKNKEIAEKSSGAQLKKKDIVNQVQNWIITPVGNIDKDDIRQIANGLKKLDNGKDHRIDFQAYVSTQSGDIDIRVSTGDANINTSTPVNVTVPVNIYNRETPDDKQTQQNQNGGYVKPFVSTVVCRLSCESPDGNYKATRDGAHYKIINVRSNRITMTGDQYGGKNDVKAGAFASINNHNIFGAAYHYGHGRKYTWIGIWDLEKGNMVTSVEKEGFLYDISPVLIDFFENK